MLQNILHKKPFNIAVALFLSGAAIFAGPQLNMTTAIDVGRVENGSDLDTKIDGLPLDISELLLLRSHVNIGFTEQINPKSLFTMGVGGILWKPYGKTGGGPETKFMKLGPAISHAYMQQSFTDNAVVTYGYIPYKYNRCAKNLGEYMFRSEAYPTILYTGGWSWMNSAGYGALGGKFTWDVLDGRLKNDFVLFMEIFNAPLYDITPAYVGTFQAADFLTLGGAVSFHRLITPSPEVEDQITQEIQYYKQISIPGSPNRATFRVNNDNALSGMSIDTSWALNTAISADDIKSRIFNDPDNMPLLMAFGVASAQDIILDTVNLRQGQDAANYERLLREDLAIINQAAHGDTVTYPYSTTSFDNAALKLGAFFELDFRAMLGKAKGEMGDFNIYGEAALLGLKNYDVLYTGYGQRFVKMLGFSLPIPWVFDHLSLEIEHLNNPNAESIKNVYSFFNIYPDQDVRMDINTRQFLTWNKDDFKWSLHAGRKIGDFFTLYLQVANDHLRIRDVTATPTYFPITNEKSHLYWLARIQWGL